MWNRRSLLFATTFALTACGVASGGYRDLSSDYDRTTYQPHTLDDGDELFADAAELRCDAVIDAVVARNPSVVLARQGWRAALARYPQATSYSDPIVGVTLAPLSAFDSDVKLGVGAQVTQPLPYPGKRRLRGEVALAEADAARQDFRAVTQRLALMASQLYYDYYVLERALEINREHIGLLEEYARSIDAYLATGKTYQDDALKVDVDLAELQQQRGVLESNRDVVVAQLNALLHRNPRAALPPPPAQLPAPPAVEGSADELQAAALAQRPELAGASSRERGAAAGVELAERDYYPDFQVSGIYNRMWPMISHQFMVGLSVSLPVMRSRRSGAVDAARAQRARTHAERARVTDDVLRDVEIARRRTAEADQSATLYRERVLPAARGRVDAVRVGLDAGRTNFIEVIRAERDLRAAQLRYYTAAADAYRRRAELDWATGRVPGAAGEQGGGR